MSKDWTGNTNSVFKTLSASNHTDEDRENNDYYATDPKAIDYLVRAYGDNIHEDVWECACGQGHLAKRLSDFNYFVYSSDLIDRGYSDNLLDFLKGDYEWNGDIITNPPYKYAKEFIEKALDIVEEGRNVIMFLKIQFLEGKARRKLFDKYPPKYVLISSSRILCAKNGDFEKAIANGGSAVAYAWYIWEKGFKGDTVLKWIN